ncbi:MAG TPA: hypothetical protein VFY39_07535, partial [Gammaproteobacteria bacterium]|nr:hypothetical protein [Gammaproteobacteria bacterium]
VELYVKTGFTPPPPPIGNGKIEVPAAGSQESASPPGAGTAAPPGAGSADTESQPATAAPAASSAAPSGAGGR